MGDGRGLEAIKEKRIVYRSQELLAVLCWSAQACTVGDAIVSGLLDQCRVGCLLLESPLHTLTSATAINYHIVPEAGIVCLPPTLSSPTGAF